MIDQGITNVHQNDFKFAYEMNQIKVGLPPMYGSQVLTETIPPAGSGITSRPISRKRSRDFCSSVSSFQIGDIVDQSQLINREGLFTFLDQDISMQMHQQQLEIQRFIDQHTDNMRLEIKATPLKISTKLIDDIAQEGIKRLKSKEDEITKIKRLNSALQQNIQILTVDNQIWQQTAKTNEATSIVLRRNLQQILTQIQQQHDDESCCGSNYDDEHHNQHKRTLAKLDILDEGNDRDAYYTTISDNNGSRWCRNCGKTEMCVLVLPCRHLCICTVCESSIKACPVCKCTKNASVHVNMNSF